MQPENQRDHKPRYTLIPRVLIFPTRENSILLLKGAADKRLWAGKYNGIGGHLEAGETPLQAARRELFEETGLQTDTLDLRAVVHIAMPEPPGIMMFVFTSSEPAGALQASVEGQPEWVPMERLYTLPLVEDLHTLLPHILGNEGLTYARYTFDDAGLHIHFD